MANVNKSLDHKKRLQIFAFLGVVLFMLVLVALILKPLVTVLLLSGILTVIFRPLYNYLLKHTKSPAAASGLTVSIVLVGLFLFIYIFGQLLFNELVDMYAYFREGNFVLNREVIINYLPAQLHDTANALSADINNVLSRVTVGVFQSFTSILSNLASFFFNLFLVFFSFYYLLKDASKLKKLILQISPISDGQETILLSKIIRSVNGVVKGTFFVAMIQSAVACIGFLIFDVPNPILWTMCTLIAAFIPNLGTALVMIPIIAYLFLTGHTAAAIGMAIWATVAVGLIDNFLSPKLVGHSAQLHPLLVLLSVIGGLQLFGFLGFLLGPIFMAIFVALIDIYLTDFQEYLQN